VRGDASFAALAPASGTFQAVPCTGYPVHHHGQVLSCEPRGEQSGGSCPRMPGRGRPADKRCVGTQALLPSLPRAAPFRLRFAQAIPSITMDRYCHASLEASSPRVVAPGCLVGGDLQTKGVPLARWGRSKGNKAPNKRLGKIGKKPPSTLSLELIHTTDCSARRCHRPA